MPTDTPLRSVVDQLDAEGWTGQFIPLEGARLRCGTCRAEFGAAGRRADHVTRLEGASDPADMVIVVPLVCPVCGTRGTFVSHYGAEATAEADEVLAALDRTPREGSDGRATPGVVAGGSGEPAAG